MIFIENHEENLWLLCLLPTLSTQTRKMFCTDLSCSGPASARSPCRACSCCAACCCWWPRGWRDCHSHSSSPPRPPVPWTGGKTENWSTSYWQPGNVCVRIGLDKVIQESRQRRKKFRLMIAQRLIICKSLPMYNYTCLEKHQSLQLCSLFCEVLESAEIDC